MLITVGRDPPAILIAITLLGCATQPPYRRCTTQKQALGQNSSSFRTGSIAFNKPSNRGQRATWTATGARPLGQLLPAGQCLCRACLCADIQRTPLVPLLRRPAHRSIYPNSLLVID
jgi:hypothetical protein